MPIPADDCQKVDNSPAGRRKTSRLSLEFRLEGDCAGEGDAVGEGVPLELAVALWVTLGVLVGEGDPDSEDVALLLEVELELDVVDCEELRLNVWLELTRELKAVMPRKTTSPAVSPHAGTPAISTRATNEFPACTPDESNTAVH